MSTRPNSTAGSILNLEHLRKQAKALLRAAREGNASAKKRLDVVKPKLSDAQHAIAKENGFASWPKLRAHLDATSKQASEPADESRALPKAANEGEIEEVRQILEHGEYTQHDLDLALARACMRNVAIAPLLVEHGANPNGEYGGNYGPIILAACEAHAPDGVKFLIDHGADVRGNPRRKTKYPDNNTPMRMTIGTYLRGDLDRKHRCIELLIEAGAEYEDDAVIDIHRGRIDSLRARLTADPSLVHQLFDLDYGSQLSLRGVTLLHIAAEFNERAAVDLLLERGADLNARAAIGPDGLGGQTPIFHVIGSNQGSCFPLVEHLLSTRPNLSVRAKIQANPTLYDWKKGDDVLDLTPLAYALRYEHEPQWREASREVKALRDLK
ncbi:MAG TPA: ankyrin repeat domain-containing protein, partial [Tepidisphaeraceae bacterium]|nr:ankyrin repeat domain-containing protein [Tepidisphaeraceae bacterium]